MKIILKLINPDQTTNKTINLDTNSLTSLEHLIKDQIQAGYNHFLIEIRK